jgi:hypothetical protein
LELALNKSKVFPDKEIIFGAPAPLRWRFYRRVDFIIVMDFIVKPGKCNPRPGKKMKKGKAKENAEIFSNKIREITVIMLSP